MTNHRWRTSIHEAAHGVVAILLGGKCRELAIHTAGGGIAFIHDLPPCDRMIAIAAASEAEQLLADCPPPATEPKPEAMHQRATIAEPTTAEKLQVIAAKHPPDDGLTDEQQIARYCIDGLEDEPPERWAERYYFLHSTAGRIVSDHHDKIIKVATALYQRHDLGESEIKEILA